MTHALFLALPNWAIDLGGWLALITALGAAVRKVYVYIDKKIKQEKCRDEKIDALSVLIKEQSERSTQSVEKLDHLILLNQTTTKYAIEEIVDRSLKRSCILPSEKKKLRSFWLVYEANGWNHITKAEVETALALPVKGEKLESEDNTNGLE